MLCAEGSHLGGQFAHLRLQHIVTCGTQHKSVGEIVYVFGGAAKMNEFTEARRLRACANFFTDKILNGLHVMIGRRFNRLNALCVISREAVHDIIEDVFHDRRKRRQFRNGWLISHPLQPSNFDQDPVADQAVFTQDVAESADFACVTTVSGGKGSQFGTFHPGFALDLGAESANHTPKVDNVSDGEPVPVGRELRNQ